MGGNVDLVQALAGCKACRRRYVRRSEPLPGQPGTDHLLRGLLPCGLSPKLLQRSSRCFIPTKGPFQSEDRSRLDTSGTQTSHRDTRQEIRNSTWPVPSTHKERSRCEGQLSHLCAVNPQFRCLERTSLGVQPRRMSPTRLHADQERDELTSLTAANGFSSSTARTSCSTAAASGRSHNCYRREPIDTTACLGRIGCRTPSQGN